MKFSKALEIVGDEPVFETGLLLAGDVDARDIRRQLSLWVKSNKLIQLRRSIYALAEPYRKTHPHKFVIANRMLRGSYVSLQSALAFYGLIPEYVPVTLSVSTRRPNRWDTEFGRFEFRHITRRLFSGYQNLEVISGQHAYVATPEKALLDLVHLTPGGDNPDFLDGLRLQNLPRVNLNLLHDLAILPKLRRAADIISDRTFLEQRDYEAL